MDYCDIEWSALEMNRDHSVVFEIASKYCILDLLLTMMAIPFLLRDSCPHILDIWDNMLLFSSSIMSDSLLTPWTVACQAALSV